MATARYEIEIREVPEKHVLEISEHARQSDLSRVIPLTDPNDDAALIIWRAVPPGNDSAQ
jgi:hypothetical protein